MTPDKRTQLYLTAAHMGAIGTLVQVGAKMFEWHDFIAGVGVGIMLVALVVLLLQRLRDEYIEGLWRTGTSWAFVSVVVCFLFAPFLEGLVDGFLGSAKHQDWPIESVGLLAILAFFTGFHFKWLRGLR
jgi:glucan phosphoethanolaminetransferase (alkaline phosphatase superfamily)